MEMRRERGDGDLAVSADDMVIGGDITNGLQGGER